MTSLGKFEYKYIYRYIYTNKTQITDNSNSFQQKIIMIKSFER